MENLVKTTVTFAMNYAPTSTRTYTCSKAKAWQAFKTCVVNVLFNRMEIPNGEFDYCRISEIYFVQRSERCSLHCVNAFYQWMKKTFQLFLTDSLREFYIFMNNENGNNCGEFYRFKFLVPTENYYSERDLYYEIKLLSEDVAQLNEFEKLNGDDFYIGFVQRYAMNGPLLRGPAFMENRFQNAFFQNYTYEATQCRFRKPRIVTVDDEDEES